MSAIFVLLPIISYALVFNIFLKRAVSVSIFFSITFIISILFLFGMFDILKIGSNTLFYGGIALLFFIVIIKSKDVLRFIKTVPFVIYISVSLIYLVCMYDASLFFWDEFSHWGKVSKILYYTDKFYDVAYGVYAALYTPGSATWQYFITSNTSYSEGKLYFAIFLIVFSSTLMMYEKLKFSQIHWIVFVFVLQMVIFSTFGHWFSAIYVDHMVGSIFAGLILSFFVDRYRSYDLYLFIFALVSLVLIKEIGLYFGLSFLGLVYILFITREKLSNQKSLIFNILNHKKILFILLSMFVVMILVLKSWSSRQEGLGVKKSAFSMASVVKNIGSTKESQLVKEIKKRFFEVVLYQQLHKEKLSLNYNEFSYGIMNQYKKSIKLSTLGVMIFFLILSTILYFATQNRSKKVEILVISSYMLFVTIVYLVILYLSFLVVFASSDGLRIPSYVRFFNMSTLPLLMIGFSLYLPMFIQNDYIKQLNSKTAVKKSKNNYFEVYIAGLLVLFSLIFITKPYFKPLYSQLENPFKKQLENSELIKTIIKKLPFNSKVFVVFPIRNNGNLNIILRYTLTPPLKASISRYNFDKNSRLEMLNTYKNYDYVWFVQFNNELIKKNQTLLKAKNIQNQPYVLYKVINKDTNISFKPIL